jgi:hypothetical protein
MKRIGSMVLIVVGMAAASPAGAAAFLDGNRLHEWCQDANRNFATGYIAGAADHMWIMGEIRGQHFICVPEQATLGQLRDIVCNYLRDKPTDRHYSAASVAGTALQMAWPCKE